VRFRDGKTTLARDAKARDGLAATTWRTRAVRRGTHVLEAAAKDAAGRSVSALRTVRVCSG
jgi:hypothetical protein